MKAWLFSSIIALVLWGLWGFLPKLTVQYIDSYSATIFEVLGGTIVGMVLFVMMGFRPETHSLGILFGVLAGFAGLTGALFFMRALQDGKASVVVSLTALYPLVTIILAFFILNEPLSLRELIGIGLALLAVVFLAT